MKKLARFNNRLRPMASANGIDLRWVKKSSNPSTNQMKICIMMDARKSGEPIPDINTNHRAGMVSMLMSKTMVTSVSNDRFRQIA